MGEDRSREKTHPFLDIEYQLYYGSARPTKVFNLTMLKVISIIFVALGLIGVYYLASIAPVPTMTIDQIYGQYLLNYATVIVKGNVTGIPYLSERSGRISIRFPINDSTGEMNLYIYDPEASVALKQCNESFSKCKIPFPGDYVEALVQVRVRETYTYGIIQSIDFLKLKRNSMTPVNVTSLSISMENMYVRASGIVTSTRNVSSGLLLDLDTGEDTITVLVPKALDYMYRDNRDYLMRKQSLMVGIKANISGIVYLYRGVSPEIVPRCKEDIEIQPLSIKEVTLSEIPALVGEVVKVDVVMGQVEYESGKYVVTVYDDTGSVEAVFDKDTFVSEFDPYNIGTGSRLSIVGTVESPSRIVVMDYDVIERYPSPLLAIGDISEELDGYTVVVRGIITGLSIGSSYTIFYLEDETGRIKVFIPSSTFSILSRKALVEEGNRITLAGYIDVYRGELEIVVYTSGGIQSSGYPVPGEGEGIPVLPGAAPTPPTGGEKVSIAELENYIGSAVTVEAVFNSIGYDSDRKLYVLEISDNTGSTKALASSSLTRSVIDPWSVGCGSKLEIEGVVKQDPQLGVYIDVSSISVIEPVEPPTVSVAEAKDMPLGTIVIIEDVSVENPPTSPTGNWIFRISDETDEIKVFIPSSAVDKIPSDVKQAVMNGEIVSIAGYVDEYRGELEIVVYAGSGVRK